MATKTFLKNINIRDKTLGDNLVNALEHAKEKHSIDVTLTKTFREVRKDQIKALFGEEDGNRV